MKTITTICMHAYKLEVLDDRHNKTEKLEVFFCIFLVAIYGYKKNYQN